MILPADEEYDVSAAGGAVGAEVSACAGVRSVREKERARRVRADFFMGIRSLRGRWGILS